MRPVSLLQAVPSIGVLTSPMLEHHVEKAATTARRPRGFVAMTSNFNTEPWSDDVAILDSYKILHRFSGHGESTRSTAFSCALFYFCRLVLTTRTKAIITISLLHSASALYNPSYLIVIMCVRYLSVALLKKIRAAG